jgi:hypothetical protein
MESKQRIFTRFKCWLKDFWGVHCALIVATGMAVYYINGGPIPQWLILVLVAIAFYFSAFFAWQWKDTLHRILNRKLEKDAGSALFLFVIAIVFLCFLQWSHFIPKSGGAIKVSPLTGGLEITYDAERGHSESVAVIGVPAYRMPSLTFIYNGWFIY